MPRNCIGPNGWDDVADADQALFEDDELQGDDENPFDPDDTGCALCGSDAHDPAHCDTPSN